MTSLIMVFDLSLPANCPLAGASARDQLAFRLVKNNPPIHDDLLTHMELGLAEKADPCKRCSVSLFETHERALHRLALSPHLGTYVAVAELSAAHGEISGPNHNSGHMDWWPYAGMRRPTDFRVI